MRARIFAVMLMLAAAFICRSAAAQDYWPTAGGSNISGALDACLNSSAQAVPWWTPAGVWQCAGSIPFTFAPSGQTYTNIPTSTNTIIKAAPGVFAGLIVNTPGTASTAKVYDNTTCTGTIIGTFSTVVQNALSQINAAALTGICVTTADGGGAANITVLWR